MVKGKNTNSLMRHLRDEHGIAINGSKNKRDLLNMGYYHGYKGYRFIGKSSETIPYTNFDQVSAVYNFDTQLKTILYPNIMSVETALKNYTLETLVGLGPVDFENVFSNQLNDYKKESTGSGNYRKKMKRRLKLRDDIYSSINHHYSDRAVIQHFFHNNKTIPLWAIFEVISFGVFGTFIACLNLDTRIEVAKELDIHSTNHNQNGRMLEDMIFLIKDLRNAVAHNSVVFDCRFAINNAPPAKVREYVQKETGIRDITFKTIVDYFIILIVLLKKLRIPKTDLRRIIRDLIEAAERLRNAIPEPIHAAIMGTDFRNKVDGLTAYV